MVRCAIGSILHGVDPLSYFSFKPVLHDWCNKGRGMCNPVCGIVHIKEPLLLIEKSSTCGGSRFPLSLFVLYFTICLTPYNIVNIGTISNGEEQAVPRGTLCKTTRQQAVPCGTLCKTTRQQAVPCGTQ